MKNVLVIYPGFLHYRKGILDELIASDDVNYIFVGDRNGFNSIKPYRFEDDSKFVHRKTYRKGRFLLSAGLLRFVWSQKVDGAIVHASPYWITISLASLLLKLKGVKVYNWAHGILSDKKDLKNYFYYYYSKIFFSGLFLYGNIAKKNLISLGYKPNKMKVVFNSLDYKKQLKFRDSIGIEELEEVRNELFEKPHHKQILFIGRLTRWKKLDLLIEAMELLKKESVNVNLLLVGDGNQKPFLQEKIKKLGLTNSVNFYGSSYDEETNYKLIASSDCCVAPGDVGLTAMHCFMYGTPVISHSESDSQMPEFEAIVEGENGLLFQKENSEDLKNKIKDMFEIIDQSSKKEIARRCYKIIDKYYNPKFQIQVFNETFK